MSTSELYPLFREEFVELIQDHITLDRVVVGGHLRAEAIALRRTGKLDARPDVMAAWPALRQLNEFLQNWLDQKIEPTSMAATLEETSRQLLTADNAHRTARSPKPHPISASASASPTPSEEQPSPTLAARANRLTGLIGMFGKKTRENTDPLADFVRAIDQAITTARRAGIGARTIAVSLEEHVEFLRMQWSNNAPLGKQW